MRTHYAVFGWDTNQLAERASLEFEQIKAMLSIQPWPDFDCHFALVRSHPSRVDGIKNSTVNNVSIAQYLLCQIPSGIEWQCKV